MTELDVILRAYSSLPSIMYYDENVYSLYSVCLSCMVHLVNKYLAIYRPTFKGQTTATGGPLMNLISPDMLYSDYSVRVKHERADCRINEKRMRQSLDIIIPDWSIRV